MKRLLFFLMLMSAISCRAGLPLAGVSFENETDATGFKGNGIEVTNSRAQFGSKSLQWTFSSAEVLTVSNIGSLSPEDSGAKYGSHFPISPTFVMSIYNEEPMKDPLRVEFNGDTHFMVSLDFTGWRTVWVPFHEMKGDVPASGEPFAVESVRFNAPDTAGTVWLDDIVFSQYIDNRHPYPDLAVPFIKEGGAHAWDHWMPKIPHWTLLSGLAAPAISAEDKADLQTVVERLHAEYFEKSLRLRGADYYRRKFDSERILPSTGNPLPLKLGAQILAVRYELALGEEPEYVDMRSFGRLMLRLANEYLSTNDEAVRDDLSALFAEGSKYYLEQGWSAGSVLGTLHHFGYQTRELHTAFFLTRDALHEQGLLDAVGQSVRWQLNFGEVLDPEHLESNLDYYNTQSAFRLMSAFLVHDPAQQSALLQAYSDHLMAALALTSSTGGFRPDGTAWHHWGHYPAYATGAFSRIPVSLKALSGTHYRIGEAGHANFRLAFLAATVYSNPTYFGLGLAGRHPLGGNIGVLKEPGLALALSGTPDGKQIIDSEVASAYVRLWGMPEGGVFDAVEIDATPPSGHWTFPYAALSVHRRSDWSVNIKGFNTFVWASEIYNTDNRYGRYQSHGVVQILPGLPQKENGYTEAGWDWNHPPGATTIERPFAELEPKRSLVMFKSEETYAGGCALGGNGVWAMKLNEADGYTIDPVKEKMSFPGNLKARKSVFCFGEQLLCLGSGIESDDPSAPVHTTLFQNGIRPKDDGIYSNGEGLLMDPTGNAYRMLGDSKVVVTVGMQTSPNNKHSLWTGKGRGKPRETGRFAKALIDHGHAPNDGSYAYAVYPQLGAASFPVVQERIEQFPKLEIFRHDNTAHIVEEPTSRTTAYACFEPGSVGVGPLDSVSVPCYVMIQSGDTLKVSVANPDLNQQEDPVKGHFNGDSKEVPVTLRLKGRWKVKGVAKAWTVADGDSTLVTAKCKDGASVEVELENSNDQAEFQQAMNLKWKPVFSGKSSRGWKLDGEFATVKDVTDGLEFSAGPEELNHAHHAVLWTEDSFEGDIKIEYDYTRLDDVNKWVNILYIQATGKGGDFAPDIMEWADVRKEPWMKNYFETMKLLHISYAAFGRDDLGEDADYVRCRRYPKSDDGGFSKTEIKPDSFHTGLFRTGETYRITAIKKRDRLFFNVAGDGTETLFSWQSPLIGEVTQGRVGLRHMWMKASRYGNFSVSILEK